MEVDQSSSSSSSSPSPSKSIRLHPLTIIGISDHHTRISMGGSELPRTNPTIGLLFGHTSTSTITSTSNGGNGTAETVSVVHIIDAEEVETSLDPSTLTDSQLTHIRTKIELHQKVFPTHEVVGWYTARGNDNDGHTNNDNSGSGSSEDDDGVLPTAQDLNIHCGWMKEFVTGGGGNGDGDGDGDNSSDPLFVLMDTSEPSEENNSNHEDSNKSEGEKAREKLDREQELPLSLYETTGTRTTGGGAAFVNMDFTVETYEPERIAVEKVLITQPKYQAKNVIPSGSDTKPATKDDGDAKMSSNSPSSSQSQSQSQHCQSQSQHAHAPTEAEVHLQSAISSIDGMNTRIAILLDFLNQTREGKIPPHHHLLRQVMSLIRQLPLVKGGMDTSMGMGINMSMDMGASSTSTSASASTTLKEKEFYNDYDDMLVMTYLATLAKTTSAVVGYADKFRVVEEGKRNAKMGSMGSMGIVGGTGSGTAGGNISGSGGGSGGIHLDSSSLGGYVM